MHITINIKFSLIPYFSRIIRNKSVEYQKCHNNFQSYPQDEHDDKSEAIHQTQNNY